MGGFLAEPKSQDQASKVEMTLELIKTNIVVGMQVDMLAGLAQLEFDILGLDSWWIGLTDQGHEGRCYSDSLHSWRFSSDTRPSLWRTNCGKGLPQVGVGTFIHRGGLHRLGRRVSYS